MEIQPPMKTVVDLYDFDHTIYRGDSTLDFYLYALGRKPWLIVCAPYQLLFAVLYLVRVVDRTRFKQSFFVFLRGVDDVPGYVELFWGKHAKHIKAWYERKDHTNDVIISASPEFLLQPIADRLGIHRLIATRYDLNKGKIVGKNCRGTEKLRRFQAELPGVSVREAYSDHESDKPLLSLAEKYFMVLGERVLKPQEYAKYSYLKKRYLKWF